MSLDFPNDCRSYDATADLVRFWGYDSVLEVPFLLDVAVLRKLVPLTPNEEAGILAAFDVARERIRAVASKAYSRRARKGSYLLGTADF